MPKPADGTYPPYFSRYIQLVEEDELFTAFSKQQDIINSFFDSLPANRATQPYAPGKWSLCELMQHIIDTERIFNYRALSIARGETASLPGFEENDYAANSGANNRSWKGLCEELKVVRKSSELLFRSFQLETLHNSGFANNNPVTVLAIGFILLGHLAHHKEIIEKRYLKPE